LIFFVAIAFCMITITGLVLAKPLMARGDPSTGSDSPEIDIYTQQLAEIDRDVARNNLDAQEAVRMRTEISRRILEADRLTKTSPLKNPRGPSPKWSVGILLAILAASSVGIYASLGVFGMADRPLAARLEDQRAARAARPGQTVVEARFAQLAISDAVDPEYRELVENLRKAVDQNGDDPRGLRLLAQHEANLGQFISARIAQETLLTIIGNSATAQDWTDFAQYMVSATNGYVSPQSERALRKALDLDPTNGRARYFTGLLFARTGRVDLGYRMWTDLLERGPEDAPWIKPIRDQIGALANAAGVTPQTGDPSLRGPSAEDVRDASTLTDTERQERIAGMVQGLADRLAQDGGSAMEWQQLIRAYSVLGKTSGAADALAAARNAYSGEVEILTQLNALASELDLE
jgi:cytochrome c-type biogenesis protein CcmH